jgi:hypothetical protein
MPNWSSGNISISGKKENVKEFLKFFVYQDEANGEELDRRYFARSFVQENTYQELIDKYKEEFENKEENISIDIYTEFAWSVYSCLIDGYPQKEPNKNLTIIEALLKYPVNISIETEEPGMGFEEEIYYNTENTELEYKEYDMPVYVCKKCGCEIIAPTDLDMSELECYECDNNSEEDGFKLKEERTLNEIEKIEIKEE